MTISEKQKRIILADFNAKKFLRPKFGNAIQLFEAQVKKTPDNTAIEFGKEKITYKELNKKADAVGNFLAGFLKKNQQKIYVLADKSIDMIAALLGILKSGNILVPLNPYFSAEMVKSAIEEIKPDFIIAQKKYSRLLKKAAKHLPPLGILLLDASPEKTLKGNNFEFINFSCIDRFPLKQKKFRQSDKSKSFYAYIYFISGSIGQPKAAVATNFSFAARIAGLSKMADIYLKNKFRSGHFLSAFMDFTTFGLTIMTLCRGATLCLPTSNNLLFNGRALIKWLEDNEITCTSLPVNSLKYFVAGIKNRNQLKNLKLVSVRGAKLVNDKYLRNFFDKIGSRIKLLNIYGMAEAPTSFYYEVSKDDLDKDIMPSGKSFTAKAIALNDKKEIQPPGEIGEVYIRSPFFVGCGYYNNAELTKKVFIKNPFSQNPKDIILRTGHIGRLLPDGNLEVVGRGDDQVTIAGFRIGLAEIEAKMLAHPQIENCVVLAKKNKSRENYLIAYYTARGHLDERELTAFLRRRLSDYELPNYFVRLAKMPLNLNRKVDRLALAAIDETKYYRLESIKRSKNEIEETLLNIWQEVLNKKQIGINDNFFDAGGNSLKMFRLQHEIKKKFKIEIPMVLLFQHPTIDYLARYLADKGSNRLKDVVDIQRIEEGKAIIKKLAQKNGRQEK